MQKLLRLESITRQTFSAQTSVLCLKCNKINKVTICELACGKLNIIFISFQRQTLSVQSAAPGKHSLHRRQNAAFFTRLPHFPKKQYLKVKL